MDFATLVGLIAGIGLVTSAIVTGGNAIIFVNPPSLMIVVGGTISVILMKFPAGEVFNSLRVMKNAFFFQAPSAVAIINQIIDQNPDQVSKLVTNPKIIGWFVGQVMKKTEGKANPKSVNDLLQEKLQIK